MTPDEFQAQLALVREEIEGRYFTMKEFAEAKGVTPVTLRTKLKQQKVAPDVRIRWDLLKVDLYHWDTVQNFDVQRYQRSLKTTEDNFKLETDKEI